MQIAFDAQTSSDWTMHQGQVFVSLSARRRDRLPPDAAAAPVKAPAQASASGRAGRPPRARPMGQDPDPE